MSIQKLEELNLSSNGITGAGLKALDGVLQSNVVLKTLNLSGNPIGEEGAKVFFETVSLLCCTKDFLIA